MRAGRANKTITIQRSTNALDDYGQQIKTFADLATMRAEVKVIFETENRTGGKYEGRTQYAIKTRYTDVDKTDRIIYGSKTLEIIDVIDPSMRKADLTIRAASDE